MDENENYDSDEEISEKEHSRLLQAISRLDKSQHIKKVTRTEPAFKISEYNLVKSANDNEGSVHLNDLLKTLNKNSTHTEINKKLNKIRHKIKTLPKPLEKPEASKIKRTIGFENIKKTLDRWEPVICANRAAGQIVFPLVKETKLEIKEKHDLMSRFRLKSQLELEMEKLDPPQPTEEEKEEFPFSLDEILERRKEAAKLRAQQSYRESKARRQNKIKSKKYHRIQRREKIKQQIKEFELLQKNNPEEALKKLEEIEKVRAEERMSLRHRSTGKWAQNRQIRAKYDKESRQALAQQLSVSRDLSQKIQNNESSGSEDEDQSNQLNTTDNSNPWINSVKPSDEVTDFISSYRKYWSEKNKMENLKMKIDTMTEAKMAEDNEISENETENEKVAINNEIFENDVQINGKENNLSDNDELQDVSDNELDEFKEKMLILNKRTSTKKNKCSETDKSKKSISKTQKVYNAKSQTKHKESKAKVLSTEDGWSVEPANNQKRSSTDIDTIFDDVDYKIQSKLQKEAKKLKQIKNEKISIKKTKKSKKKYKPDLALKSQRPVRPEIDAPLTELPSRDADKVSNDTVSCQNTIISQKPQSDNKTPDIDPSSFIKIVPKHIKTANPDFVTHEEAMDDENIEIDQTQKVIITEAFEDDDIVDEFRLEKQAEIDADKPKDIDLSLPGWGSWGGANIKQKPKKRFIIKMPKKVPRKDDNKGDLIIKEYKNTKIKEHQVNELPFPFQNVKDFEASIRAPISNTFVPETAYKRLIKPSVVTKVGAVIEPMDENQLLLNEIKKLKRKL